MEALDIGLVGDVDAALEQCRASMPGWAWAIIKGSWDHSKHPRDEHGRFTSGPGMAKPEDVHEVPSGGSGGGPAFANPADVHEVTTAPRKPSGGQGDSFGRHFPKAPKSPPPLKPRRPPPARHAGFHTSVHASAVGKAYSREYLEEALAAAQEHLPGWATALIHQHALPRSGGRARGRAKPTPGTMDKVAIRAMSSADLSGMADNELLGVWGQLADWYDGRPDGDLYEAANTVMDELESRGVQVDRQNGLGADATVRKSMGDTSVRTVDNLGDALGWLATTGAKTPSVVDLMMSARRAFDGGDPGIYLRGANDVMCLSRDAYRDVAKVVPTQGPHRAPVAFVGAMPSPTDAARGEPFTGGDGAALVERYLRPLGLAKADVLLTHIVPVLGASNDDGAVFNGWVAKELDTYRPRIVVALGRVAKAALGSRAHFSLPHPAAVRKLGDTGGLDRKLRKIASAIDAALSLPQDIDISKADDSKQTVYGVVLDPYQVDTQGDWIPASEIERTAHDYMAGSRMVGFQHATRADAVVVESTVVQYPSDADYRAAMANQPHRAYRMPFGDQYVHSGAWILGTRINDPGVWDAVQKGEIGAYSIGGSGIRTEITPQHMPNVVFLEMRGVPIPGPEPEPAQKADSDVGGHDAPPKEYARGGATERRHYADPKNYKYPIDTEAHVRAAISYFSKPKNANVYSAEQQKKIWARIRRAADKFGITISRFEDE